MQSHLHAVTQQRNNNGQGNKETDKAYLAHAGGLVNVLLDIVEDSIVVSQENALERATTTLQWRGAKGCGKLRGVGSGARRLKINHDGGSGGAEMCRMRIDEIKPTTSCMLAGML